MGTITLVTGGARSGKSAYALRRGDKSDNHSKVFIATAVILDDEMKKRVENHKRERNELWNTIEEPYDLSGVVDKLDNNSIAVIDCCTVWLGNVWYKEGRDDTAFESKIDSFCKALEYFKNNKTGEVFIVSNEVGWGIVPSDPAVRLYRDWVGKLNQRIAELSHEVYLCVAGIPVKIKPTEERA